MFRKSKPRDLPWRALPLRNEQITISNGLAVLPGQIWFTPEVIVLDATRFVTDIIWFWQTFRRLIPVFILRTLVLSVLFFLVIGFKQSDLSLASAQNISQEAAGPVAKLEIKTKIKAREHQVFAWPIGKSYVTTFFSYFHKGIDMPSSYGKNIKPFTGGVVIFAGWDGGFGKSVHIRHQDGYMTKYAHLSVINVRLGQKVGSSTSIGKVGTTGVSTGSHLHFEIRKNGVAINPLGILP